MAIKQQLDIDLKQAMLAGNKTLATTLRGLKSAILYAEVAKGSRDEGLPEAEIIDLFGKEAKKRQESADLFKQGGNDIKAQEELTEKAVIEGYLPSQLGDEELFGIIDASITELGASGMQAMGQVIAHVKNQTAGKADGGRIASIVKDKLSK